MRVRLSRPVFSKSIKAFLPCFNACAISFVVCCGSFVIGLGLTPTVSDMLERFLSSGIIFLVNTVISLLIKIDI